MIRFLDMREKLKDKDYPCLCLFGNDGWVRHKAVSNVCEAYNVPNDGFSVDVLESPVFDDIKLACATPVFVQTVTVDFFHTVKIKAFIGIGNEHQTITSVATAD